MSTCTDLIDSINAVVVDPSLLASLDPSTIATLDHTVGTTETVFQLVGGGAAVLSLASAPSVDGKLFRLIFSGQPHQDEGISFGLYVGTSTTLGSDSKLTNGVSLSVPISGRDGNFFAEGLFIWDSVTQKINGAINYLTEQQSFSSVQPLSVSVASQSDLKFVLTCKFNVNDSYNTATITQFEARF